MVTLGVKIGIGDQESGLNFFSLPAEELQHMPVQCFQL